MALWLKKYDVFDFSRDHTIKVSRDFLGGSPSSWISTLIKFWGPGTLRMLRQNVFELTRDHVIDVSRDLVGEVPSS